MVLGMAVWPVDPAGESGKDAKRMVMVGCDSQRQNPPQRKQGWKKYFCCFYVSQFTFKHELFIPQLRDTFPIIQGRVFNINIAIEL